MTNFFFPGPFFFWFLVVVQTGLGTSFGVPEPDPGPGQPWYDRFEHSCSSRLSAFSLSKAVEATVGASFALMQICVDGYNPPLCYHYHTGLRGEVQYVKPQISGLRRPLARATRGN